MTVVVDHVALANAQIAAVEDKELPAAVLLASASIAQVHATLALVEQQRIANVIALGSHHLNPSTGELIDVDAEALTDWAYEQLGLDL